MIIPGEVDDKLRQLWEDARSDYSAWSFVALRYLKSYFQTDSDGRGSLQSTRILYGSRGEHELVFGELIAVAVGVVFLRADWRAWSHYGGLLVRDDQAGKFSLISATDITAKITIKEYSQYTSWAQIEHSSIHGMSTEIIEAGRWKELRDWLNRWLPSQT